MKNIVFLIPLLFFLSVNELKIISYNIRYNNPNDGINVWENRKSTITNFLIDESPDFIGLQEVKHSQLLFLLESMLDYNFIGVGRDDGKTKGEYSPIFYNKNKFKVLFHETFWLSPTPKKVSVGWVASMERICTYGLFENINSNQKIWIFNTHFDHIGNIARKESANLILKTIDKINNEKLPVILTGDFNLEDNNPIIKKIQKQLTDVQFNVDESNKYYGTFSGFKHSKIIEKRIDYIFTKNIKPIQSKHIHLKTPYNGWASDHHPVLTTLKF